MVPGGFSAHATEIEQEGLRLPPVKLFKRGAMDPEIYAILCSNMRVADQRIGDIKAQAAALHVGERRLTGLIDRYGLETITAAIEEMRAKAALLMRSYIAGIPDGTYRSEAFVDSDGIVNEPLKIALAVAKADGVLTFDFSGSSPPCRGPMNSVVATTYSAVYLAMRHIFPDIPLNAGAFEPLRIRRPEGTFLDARYPRPVSGCAAEVSQRIAEAVFLALVQAIPDKVTAAPAGSSGNFALGGFDPAKDTGYVMYQISGGGYGGNADHDGLSNGCSTIGISKTPPVEVMEQYFPVLYHRFALREGSGGAGERRGGFGVHYEVELLRGDAQRLVRDGPRPLRSAGRAGRGRRRTQRRARPPQRHRDDAGAPVQGPGHRHAGRRPGGGDDAGRRRLRRSVRARAREPSPAMSGSATTAATRCAPCSAWPCGRTARWTWRRRSACGLPTRHPGRSDASRRRAALRSGISFGWRSGQTLASTRCISRQRRRGV